MEIDTQNIEREIIETREKQQSLHSEKGRDMQDSNQIYCFSGIWFASEYKFFGSGHCWVVLRLVLRVVQDANNCSGN